MNKDQYLLIVGCSHASGSEIDGTDESKYNREHSFGNLLANKLNRIPINAASSGSTNSTIARSVLEWFDTSYNSETMDVMVLISWTESSRMEIPSEDIRWYGELEKAADWLSTTHCNFLRINHGWQGNSAYEKKIIPSYQRFLANNYDYLEIYSANLVLQIQYFLQSKNIDYIMCNSMYMFKESKYLDFYLKQIDQSKYINMMNEKLSFYWNYRNKGYENTKAKYWHHDEEPHRLYAKKLFKFIKNQ
jgi:hypothetical protein